MAEHTQRTSRVAPHESDGLGLIKFAPVELEVDGKSTATWMLGPPDFGSTVNSAGVVTTGFGDHQGRE